MQDIIAGMDQRDFEKAALRGEPSYVWRAGQQRRLDMIVQAAGERIRGRRFAAVDPRGFVSGILQAGGRAVRLEMLLGHVHVAREGRHDLQHRTAVHGQLGVRPARRRIGEREALRYLATIHKDDPDPEVRDLALKAGQHIKQAGTRDEWSGTGDPKATSEMAIPKAPVSEADVKTSKKMMEQALGFAMKEEFEDAEVLVRKAFALNSNLQYDSYFTGIASDVLGIELEKVVAELLKKDTK